MHGSSTMTFLQHNKRIDAVICAHSLHEHAHCMRDIEGTQQSKQTRIN